MNIRVIDEFERIVSTDDNGRYLFCIPPTGIEHNDHVVGYVDEQENLVLNYDNGEQVVMTSFPDEWLEKVLTDWGGLMVELTPKGDLAASYYFSIDPSV